MEAIIETITSFLSGINLDTITALLSKIDFEEVYETISTAVGYLTEVVLAMI